MERKEEGKKEKRREETQGEGKRRKWVYIAVILLFFTLIIIFSQNRFLVVFALYSSKGIILSFFLKRTAVSIIITLFSLHLHSQFPVPSHFSLFISSYPLSTRQTRHPPRPPLPSLPSPFHPSFFLDSSSPPPPTVFLKPFLRPPYPPPPTDAPSEDPHSTCSAVGSSKGGDRRVGELVPLRVMISVSAGPKEVPNSPAITRPTAAHHSPLLSPPPRRPPALSPRRRGSPPAGGPLVGRKGDSPWPSVRGERHGRKGEGPRGRGQVLEAGRRSRKQGEGFRIRERD